MSEKVVLSKCQEYELKGGVSIKVYPASLETLALLDPSLKKLDNLSAGTPLKEQIELFCSVVYELIKEDNEVKKEDLKKYLTIEACSLIIEKAIGAIKSVV
jgi:hypothetical protein